MGSAHSYASEGIDMDRALLFWVLLLLWLVLDVGPRIKGKNWSEIGSTLLVWGSVALLGWAVFGAPIRS